MTVPHPHSSMFSHKGAVYTYAASRRKKQDEKVQNSRCCQPRKDESVYQWQTYWYCNHADVQDLVSWLANLPEKRRERILGQIDEMLTAAEQGMLNPKTPKEPIKAIEQGEDLFELRWKFNDFEEETKLLRQYHVEPMEEKYQEMLIASHLHLKQVEDLSPEEVSLKQDKAIRQAQHRYLAGKPSGWEIDKSLVHPYDRLLDLLGF